MIIGVIDATFAVAKRTPEKTELKKISFQAFLSQLLKVASNCDDHLSSKQFF